MSDLVDFLNARLDEDEAVATDALTRDHWAYEGYGDYGPFVSGAGVETEDSPQGQQIARYLVAMNPWRVLAEVQAKRRIVALMLGGLWDLAEDAEARGLNWEGFDYGWSLEAHAGPDVLTRDQYVQHLATLRLLASVYKDHEGYDERWTP